MPGGSVNGRPFRDEASSYASSGVPRGNPSRIFHHGIMRMGSSFTGDLVPSDDKVETEGERQLKALAKKQVATEVTLEGQLKQRKQFTTATLYKPLVQEVQGELSLKDYKLLAQKDGKIEELRQLGLTKEELDLKLHVCTEPAEGSGEKRRRLGIDPAIQEMRLKEIDAKIQSKQLLLSKPDKFNGVKQLSRHEFELEKTLLCHSNNQNVYSRFVQQAPRRKSHIPIICEGHEKYTGSKNVKKNAIDDGGGKDPEKSEWEPVIPVKKETAKFCVRCEKVFVSKDNVKVCESCIEESCSTSTVEDAPTLCGPMKVISDEEIKSNRLSAEEIRKLPRFMDYDLGERNKILYLKNLASGVTEFDLVSLFGRFQSTNGPKIHFRLMSGRMKGQAFVTFDDEEVAFAALSLVNGYMLYGKPIVIQFGKKPTVKDKG